MLLQLNLSRVACDTSLICHLKSLFFQSASLFDYLKFPSVR